MARSGLFAWFAVLAVMATGWSSASAQDVLLQELYGRGVHAYNANDYAKATERFTTAIERGCEDPSTLR